MRSQSLRWVQEWREAGLVTDYAMAPLKSDKQFKRALDAHALFTAKLEKNEGGELMIRLKRLQDRQEQVVKPEAVAGVVRATS